MEVRCEKCQARYRVDDARIGPQGLTMRCGKCQNTFKVMRAPAPAETPAPPAPPPGPPPRSGGAQTTMIFAAPPPTPPPPAAKPAAPPPPSPAAPPAPAAKTVPPQPAGEAAGRTMMFQTGNLKAPATPKAPVNAPAPAPPKPPAAAPPGTGTVVFSQPPAAKPAPAVSKPAAPKPAPSPGGTMVFNQPPAAPAARAAPAAPAPPPRDPARSTIPFSVPQATPVPPPAAPPQPAPIAGASELPQEPPAPEEAAAEGEPGDEAANAAAEPRFAEAAPPPPPAPAPSFPTHPPQDEPVAEELAQRPGTFDRAPPRGLIIGVAAGLGLLLLVGGGLVTWRKFGRRPPPAVAVEALASAQADADKDTLASISSAESKAREAVDAAGARARFVEGTALLARIEIQWADALNDQVAQLADKGGDESRTAQLQAQAKAKLKSAFDLLSPALKANKESPDLLLAFADYYRAQRLPSSMNRYLGNVKDDPRAALIRGMALPQDEEGAAKAIPLLKGALAANPQSARIQYRLAIAQLAAKDEAAARVALNEALRLSPQHERAKALLEQLPQASTAAPK